MTQEELFGVAVRVIGLLVFLIALWLLTIGLLALILGGPTNTGAFILGIPTLFVGHWLLRGAKSLVSYAFCDTSSETLNRKIETHLQK